MICAGLLLLGALSLTAPKAQEDEYDLGNTDVFGSLRRPMVKFSHAVHSDSLMEAGCGVCHHSRDDKTGKLVYIGFPFETITNEGARNELIDRVLGFFFAVAPESMRMERMRSALRAKVTASTMKLPR